MKICVLQPSYEGTSIDYQLHDPPRDLAPLLPGDEVHHAFLRKATTYRQLRELARGGFEVFVNLCEGYLDWEIPSIDVIWTLERLGLPYTGPTMEIYDPPKDVMKRVAAAVGVATPRSAVVRREQDLGRAEALRFPVFVKPNTAGDSLGVDRDSLAEGPAALRAKALALLAEHDSVMVEEYVAGRELTVLVAGEPGGGPPRSFRPVEFVFPPGESFKTYDLKVRQSHPELNVPCADAALAARVEEAARRIFRGFSAVGYARMDFRLGRDLQFLEVNFACSVFYPEGYRGSADYILIHDGIGQAGFLRHIIAEGLARHRRRRRRWAVADGLEGAGIRATEAIAAGAVVFALEEKAQRLATPAHVERAWSEPDKEDFRRYAYPARGAYVLWDTDPANWANQNHSCAPNTAFDGLDLVALRDIAPGEELTVDYATFCGPDMREFDCRCGAPNCRGVIRVPQPQ